MKIHSLFGYGHRIFCSVLVGCALIGPRSAFAHSPLGIISKHLIIQQQVTGTTSDASGVLAGVTVTVKGTAVSVLSDSGGRYAINASERDVLVFSFLGYSNLETAVNGAVLNAVLAPDVQSLQEVTVNAGYYSVKEKERTGSIARITFKDIETQPVTNVLATMQGRMPGVRVTQDSGVAGGGFNIEIRGRNSLRTVGNNPLYIIDGVPYASDPIGTSSTSHVLGGSTSPLNSINPDNIESIEVLKDADATAIYGSRGANGVVLISTKRGKAGATKFNLGYSKGLGVVTRMQDLMDTQQYLLVRKQAFLNDNITSYPASAYDVNGTWDENRYTDWQKVLLGGTAEFTSANASVSGGNASSQFLLSGNFLSQTSVFPGSHLYKKVNFHANANHASESGRFRAGFSGVYTVQDNSQPTVDLTREAISLAPNAPAHYLPDGSLNWENGTFTNPLRNLEGSFGAQTHDLVASANLSYAVFSGLEAKLSLGYSDLRHVESNTSPSTAQNPAFGLGSSSSILFLGNTDRQSYIMEPQLNYKASLGDARFDFLLGGTFQGQKGLQLAQRGIGFPSNSLINSLAFASIVQATAQDDVQYRYQAFFGRANLNFRERYILNVTGRRDGSSRFGPGNQFASFAAAGGAWLFYREEFLSMDWLSFGKLRASYGSSGSDQIGDYQFLDTYSSSGTNYGGVTGLEPARLYNPDFAWETSRKFEAALDLGFFSDRIFLSAGWYSNRSSSQLVGVPMPATTGFASVQSNLDAAVENTGLELSLRTVNFQRKGFSWTSSLNITISKNRLVSFPNLSGSTYRNQFEIGQPLNIQKVYRYEGIDPDTGLYSFADYNNDGALSAGDDRQLVKDLNPKFFGGLQNTIQVGGFSLDFLLQFARQENWNAVSLMGMPGRMSNNLADIPASLSSGSLQPYSTGANSAAAQAYSRYAASDAAISDASYIRLKNIAASYVLPASWIPGLKCSLVLQGQNLLTFTSYRGADPEFRQAGFLPPLKVVTTGLQLEF